LALTTTEPKAGALGNAGGKESWSSSRGTKPNNLYNSDEKAKAAEVPETDSLLVINEVKLELRLIKWGSWINYCCRSITLDEKLFCLIE